MTWLGLEEEGSKVQPGGGEPGFLQGEWPRSRGRAGGKSPSAGSAAGVAGRKACPGVTELNPQGQDLGVRVQPGS